MSMTPSCPLHECLAACQNLEMFYRCIAEILTSVFLLKKQHTTPLLLEVAICGKCRKYKTSGSNCKLTLTSDLANLTISLFLHSFLLMVCVQGRWLCMYIKCVLFIVIRFVMDTLTQVVQYHICKSWKRWSEAYNQKQEAQRAKIVHLSISFWNGTQADTCNDLHEKHKLGGGRWVLASCKVSMNSVQRIQRRSRKCLSQSEAGVAILVFPSNRPKNTKLGKNVEILFPVKFRQIPFMGFREKVKNVSANQRPGWPSWFSDQPKNTNLVEDVEILLPVKFHWIPFSGFRGEVENVKS